jgi:hypothetical protein
MQRLVTTLFCLSALTACVVHVGNDAHAAELTKEHQQLTLDAAGFTNLAAITGPGDITIIGDANATKIVVDADLYYQNRSDLTFTLEGKGDQARLVADSNQNGISVGWNESPYIDVTVRMPAALALSLEDGSGDVSISGLTQQIRVEDGSGELSINGGNDVRVTDGSGDIAIQQAQGAVKVDDGSGDLNISDVKGAVEVSDGSGDLLISRAGAVKIDDGSGDISVSDADSLTVDESGSGELSYSNIRGRIQTDEDDDQSRK